MGQENSINFIHPSAHIDEGSHIGHNTYVWHNCHIMSKAVIGENCSLGQNVFVAKDVQIGNRVKIQNNISVFAGVECEDDVFLGPSMTFTNVINPRSEINRMGEIKHTLIRRGATIGAQACIICGIEIGTYSFIGAGTTVVRDVKPFELVIGNPGKVIGWMSKAGQRLNFDINGIASCSDTGEKYMFNKGVVEEVGT